MLGNSIYYTGLVTRKSFIRVCKDTRLNPACSAGETSWNIPIFHEASLAMIVVLRVNNNDVILVFTFVFRLLECQVFSDKAHTNHILNGHSKIDKTKVLKTNGSLMKGESIAECSLEHSVILSTCIKQ